MNQTLSTQQSQGTQPTVSVVIPTLNSAQTLEKCLTSVRANHSKYSYEIIVADAGSKDETLEIAQKYAHKVLNGMPSRINRNIGVEAAHGEIICFTDSDCVVPDNWIDELADGLLRLNKVDSRVIGVGGGNIPLLENPTLEELAVAKTMRSPFVSFKARNTAVYKKEQEVNHNPPLNSALFKWAVLEVGGFREEYGYGGEDLALDGKLIERGYKLYYLPNVLVYHRHKSNFEKFAQQMREFGRKRVRLNREYKRLAKFYHYGPLFLCLMVYSPLVFIPFGMALLNSIYVSLKEKNFHLLSPLIRLTMSFYVNYGRGELEEIRKR